MRKRKTEIVSTESAGTVLDYEVDENEALLFWDDVADMCKAHMHREVTGESYDRGLENLVIRNTLKRTHIWNRAGKKYVSIPMSHKVISLSALPQSLRANLEPKHSLMNRANMYNALVSLIDSDCIFTFPSRSDDTKTDFSATLNDDDENREDALTHLIRWRLSAVLSAKKGIATKKQFVFYSHKPNLTSCKNTFPENIRRLLKARD